MDSSRPIRDGLRDHVINRGDGGYPPSLPDPQGLEPSRGVYITNAPARLSSLAVLNWSERPSLFCKEMANKMTNKMVSMETDDVEASYWDWLPPEIQAHIHKIAFVTQLTELNGKVKKLTVPQVKFMVPLNGQLAMKWGHHVWRAPHGDIYGLHLNKENRREFIFLGWTEEQALQRVNFVKSFL